MKRKVSVIIPVYNCKDFLTRAINSVINQNDFYENELILVDDGSTDCSGAICDEFAEKYDNITVVHQKNAGVSAARNNGIKIAQGEWVFFLDSDDYILKDAFEIMLGHGDADIICAKHDSNISDLPDFEKTLSPGVYKITDIRNELNWLLASSNQFLYPCWSKLFRLSIIRDNDVKFPVDRKYAEDMVFVYSYLLYCETVSLVKDKAYFYYVNTSNATSVVPNAFDTMYFIYKWKSEYFSNIECDIAQIDIWLKSSFLFKSFFAIKTAAEYLKGKDSIRYIGEILNNEVFYSLYVNSDEYKTFKTKTDALLDRFIRKKKPIMIFLLFKINLLKSKFLSR